MDNNQRKELLSRAYVSAIAAQVGFRSAIPDVDDDSVDLILKGRGFTSGIRNPQLEIQLKCTAKNSGCSDYFSYQLPIKNYNDLRAENLLCPRYLFVLVVPKDTTGWLVHENDHMKVKHCCYWYSLSELQPTINDTSVTVKIPRKNLLTASSMLSLMELASQRGVAA
ncbi:DUF4365 domain-containing protein [Vibrio vulnificus]|jgi:hypothetical protein|uniref:DUF4365 domain-containing protein n=1 Tax=Gammaproteobacteria TaxID=1236 RepID=UPI0005436F75|nr:MULTISPECIES: DUF4365 domain-containing protein [Vibrio]EKO3793759.1 DUF4365 domain-containing protein [Vibrio metschnikovii]ELL0578114.1 DUF4365 domain-containing protein [Vibrio cholerae]ALG52062.1 hypothetical protein FORC6_1736 [Vibrio parahaemolyticus]EGQ8038282.1 DUF4365 domain-containing protein [Vibrio parahaemolyticus]EGQ8075422.1 DUF4365 domain-containing protein [Vibrio vulnificus]